MTRKKVSEYLPSAYLPASKLQMCGKTAGNARARMSVTRIIALEKRFKDLCVEIYEAGGRERLIPLYPYVLVRLIPRDMMSPGGIVIPDKGQNKPLFEGIVLETYRPYDECRTKLVYSLDEDYSFNEGTREETITVHYECPVKRGERVVFPYFEGVPCTYLGDNYRLVRQSVDQNKFPYCQILGTIDYQGDREVAEEVNRVMNKYYFHSVTSSGESISRGGDPKEAAR